MIFNQFDLVCQWSYLVPLVSTIYMTGSLIGAAAGGPLADRLPTSDSNYQLLNFFL